MRYLQKKKEIDAKLLEDENNTAQSTLTFDCVTLASPESHSISDHGHHIVVWQIWYAIPRVD